MSKFELKLNDEGIQYLLKGPDMQGILSGIGRQKASAAGTGYSSEVHVFQKRAAVHIFPASYEAAQDNYENNTLLKVVGV